MLAAAHVIEPGECDAGAKSSGTTRMCIVTREVRPLDELIRFVVDPTGTIMPDLKRKLPGRGVWVTATRACVAEAASRAAFKRALKADVQIRPDLADFVDGLLLRSALDGLAMAHKAGLVAIGFAKVDNALAHTDIIGVIHAAEASADGIRKIGSDRRLRRDGQSDQVDIHVIRTFTQEQLDLALGRANVVHAALLAGRASETVLARWQKLEHYRAESARQRQTVAKLGRE